MISRDVGIAIAPYPLGSLQVMVPFCGICWQYTVSVGATGKSTAVPSDLAYLHKLTNWIRTALSQDDTTRYMGDGAQVIMTGSRSFP
eukprot:4274825-Pyramimonas_sp.AAC.1